MGATEQMTDKELAEFYRIKAIHKTADMEDMRAKTYRTLKFEISVLRDIKTALSRTPPKVEVSSELLEVVIDHLTQAMNRLDSIK